jgi:hypothetical protein
MLHREKKDNEIGRKVACVKNIEYQQCAITKFIYNWKSCNKQRCAMSNVGNTVFAQFLKLKRIPRGFSNRKIKDDLSKKVHTPATDSGFFIAPLPILVRLCAQLAILLKIAAPLPSIKGGGKNGHWGALRYATAKMRANMENIREDS